MEVEKVNIVDDLFRNIRRDINGLSDDNRMTRKRALLHIDKEFTINKKQLTNEDCQNILSEIIKSLVKGLSDPVEKCRHMVLELISKIIESVKDPAIFLSYILPVFVQRLSQVDIIEPSEEIRLTCVELMVKFLDLCQKTIAPFVEDYVKILQRCVTDDFPDLKKSSCQCARKLAILIPEVFHAYSEQIIPPLLKTITHQHSRVRIAVIQTIGITVQNGSNKIVGDIVPHLAQRLFDNSPSVRTAVIQIVGDWLLDMVDRYSFHRQLIPLLLTGCSDEVEEIRNVSNSLWNDVGLKYLGENEKDLKDQCDYASFLVREFPAKYDRPNLGCKHLMYSNFSKILPGALNDSCDWVLATRRKSVRLLHTMILQQADNLIQHVDKIIAKLPRPAQDEDEVVREATLEVCSLIGFFVCPTIWIRVCLDQLQLTKDNGGYGCLALIGGMLSGASQHSSHPSVLQDKCASQLIQALSDPMLAASVDPGIQAHMSLCVDNLLDCLQCSSFSETLFKLSLTLRSVACNQQQLARTKRTLEKLALKRGFPDTRQLFAEHSPGLLQQLAADFTSWTKYSTERLVFEALIVDAGDEISGNMNDILPIFTENLRVEKNPEMKIKFFSILSEVIQNGHIRSVDSESSALVLSLVRDAVLPNMLWKAGKVCKVIRKTAVATLLMLLDSGEALKVDQLTGHQPIIDDLLTQLLSTMDDDDQGCRVNAVKCLVFVFNIAGNAIDTRRLHNLYPDLLKRLDDACDDNRCVVASELWPAYFRTFGLDYQVALYRTHLVETVRGLLIHLDDQNANVQNSVLEALVYAGEIDREMVLEEISGVRGKHRSTAMCDELRSRLSIHANKEQ